MKREDLSAEDQKLLNTDFGDLDKTAAEQVKVANEMYDAGVEMAQNTADEMDKLAAEAEKEKKEDDDDEGGEAEKKAAADYGNIITEGFIDKLAALGEERHSDATHYFMPYIEEKVASVGARSALQKFAASKASFLANLKGKAGDAAKAVKGFAKNTAADAKAAVKGETARGRSLSAMERLGKLKRPGMVAGGVGAVGTAGALAARGGKKQEAAAS